MHTNWIREARIDAGMTQAELAAWVGLTPSAITRLEAGENTPALGNLYRIAMALGKSEFAAALAPFIAPPRRVRDVHVQDETLF